MSHKLPVSWSEETNKWKFLKVEAELAPPPLVGAVGVNPPLLLYKFTPCKCVRRHTASNTLWRWEVSWFVDYWMEMSDAVKPLTSFLIEDILSIKDSTGFNGKCRSQKVERCSQWEEESEMWTEQLCPQETVFGVQTGELLQAVNSRNVMDI